MSTYLCEQIGKIDLTKQNYTDGTNGDIAYSDLDDENDQDKTRR